jgi:hypothetical protein
MSPFTRPRRDSSAKPKNSATGPLSVHRVPQVGPTRVSPFAKAFSDLTRPPLGTPKSWHALMFS